MKKYEILPHKADLKIRAFGKDKKELFLNILAGMNDTISPQSFLEKIGPQRIKIESPDLAALLVDFLSEILYQTQVKRAIYERVKFKKFTDSKIEAEISGRKVERFDEDIKAVTYHNLDISQKKDGTWQATVLFDI